MKQYNFFCPQIPLTIKLNLVEEGNIPKASETSVAVMFEAAIFVAAMFAAAMFAAVMFAAALYLPPY